MSYLKFGDQQARRKAERLRAEEEEKEAQARAEKASQKSEVTEEGEEGEEEAESSGRRNGGRSIDGLGVAFRCTL